MAAGYQLGGALAAKGKQVVGTAQWPLGMVSGWQSGRTDDDGLENGVVSRESGWCEWYALTIRVLRGHQCPKAGCEGAEAVDQVSHIVEPLADVLRHCGLRRHYILAQCGHVHRQCHMCHAKCLHSCWVEERCFARKGSCGFPRHWCQRIAVVSLVGMKFVQEIAHQGVVLWGGKKVSLAHGDVLR
ncbi:hypothetical protein SCLCIDRAFT_432852 [Scleroderma citrinum Foug A]|uniref:Uncharacterized protein n=1 Tax=Scleroderma citrinum Foug A TaxID=1036808 RepID=A0A0C3DBJ6_9AGAM|nr:hypothetical protein SCLCIDRAFT_432852 [Scleroderma citrinum Foug A]